MTAPLQIRAVAPYELDTWDAFVAECPGGTLFHTSHWQAVVDATYGSGRYSLIGAWHEGRLLAGFAALTRRRLGVATAVTPLLTPYTGLITAPDLHHQPDLLMQMLIHLRQFRYQHWQCAPTATIIPLLQEAGYTPTPRRTLTINLALPPAELWQQFVPAVRRNIKKAERSAPEITDQWDAPRAYQLLADTFARQGSDCPVPRAYFDEIAQGPRLAPHRRRYAAWADGQLQAYIVALHWQGTVYYHIAAASAHARTAGLPSLLIWRLLQDHHGRPWHTFDFLGGNIEQIARFKQGFAPTPQPQVQYELCLSRRIQWGQAMRDILKRRQARH